MLSSILSGVVITLTIPFNSVPTDPPETVTDRAGFIPKRKYEPLKGTAVGVLVSDPQAILTLEGRSGPADSYCFSADGASYRWVYLTTLERPQITNLQVPVGDKGEKRTYPALNMANARGLAPAGVKASYALVRVQVNSGEGGPPGDSFVATEIRPLDGNREYPLRVAEVIADLRKRYAAHLSEQDKALNEAMDAAQKKALQDRKATGPREKHDVMYVTWMNEGERLRVHFRTRVTDGEYKYSDGGVRRGPILQKDGVRPLPVQMPRYRYGTTFGVELGAAYDVSKRGEVVRTAVLPVEGFQHTLPPPPQNRSRPVVPPLKKD
jgi:hypothetical protein